MSTPRFAFAVVGGGIVGVATARALAATGRGPVLVLEAEDRLAVHQSGHNSGVVHSGLYYRPGSLKARLSTAGREALVSFCEAEGLPFRRCGKLVLALDAAELPRLDELERRGRANGLTDLRRLAPEEVAEIEPHAVRPAAALWVGETGIADFPAVTARLAERLCEAGGEVRTGARVTGIAAEPGGLVLETASGAVRADFLVNCAGLQCDRVARLAGVEPDVAIVPFRGDYCELREDRRHLVRHPVYPVPDPAFPFLGVHFTPTLAGGVEVGPNAVLALSRRRYARFAVTPRDAAAALAWPGLWRLAARYGRLGIAELARDLSRRAFARAAARLVPAVTPADLVPAGCGLRAQAIDRQGRLLDDFHLLAGPCSLHVLNAPSPAATASFAIGEELARRALAMDRCG